MVDFLDFKTLVETKKHITIIQAENPDADSLGSSVALAEVLRQQNKTVYLHCAVEIPRYLRYISGWEEVSTDWPAQTEAAIIVDAGAKSLLEKTLQLYSPTEIDTVVFDHHDSKVDISDVTLVFNQPSLAATSELLYHCFRELKWDIPEPAAKAMVYSILGDTLGLVSIATTVHTVQIFAELVSLYSMNLYELEEKRRSLNRKPLKIFTYKQELMQRVQLHFDNQLATIDIPLQEIKSYSDLYNPAALFMEELRNVEEIRMAIAFKLYEDRITAKLREVNNAPFCHILAEHFGGGGHPYAAGFKVKETNLTELKKRVLKKFYELLEAN